MKRLRLLISLLVVLAFPISAFAEGDTSGQGEEPESAYERGRAMSSDGDHDGALAAFREAVEEDSENYKAYNMLGFTLRQKGKTKEAIVAYNKALSLKPDYAEALEYRGIAHLKAGNRKAALADYAKLIELDSPLAGDLKEKLDEAPAN